MVRFADCRYVTFQNITVDGDGDERWGIVIGSDSDVQGSPSQNNEHDIIIQGCSIINLGTTTDYTLSILVQTWENDITDITIQNDTIDGSCAWGIGCYPGRVELGATAAIISDSYIGYNVITNCGISNDGRGACIGVSEGADNIIIEHNTITQGVNGHVPGLVTAGHSQGAPNNIIWRYNDVRMDDKSAVWIQNGYAIKTDFYYNLLYTDDATNIATVAIRINTPHYTGALMRFYNNVIVSNTGQGYMDDSTYDPSVCYLINNIIISTNVTTNTHPCVVINAVGTTVHNNNALYRTVAGDPLYVIAGSYYYRSTVSGFEATAVITDPLLTDLGAFDWTISEGSPCIDAGIWVGINQDYLGALVEAGTVDMGAYEYGASPIEPPPLPDVTTEILNYNAVYALVQGVVTDDEGTVSLRGVCYSLSANPTVSDRVMKVGSGTGTFRVHIPIVAGVTFHVRTYAINESGTSYGADQTVTGLTGITVKDGGNTLKYNGNAIKF